MSNLKQKFNALEKELAEKPQISKQVRWQQKQFGLGNCIVCGKKAVPKKKLCIEHNIKRREYQRKKFGYNPKQKGKAGRNIIYHTRTI